jgi:putative flippase GtrA
MRGKHGARMNDVAVLIPAYNPEAALLDVLDGLRALGFARILVVDDGSQPECAPIFAAAAERAELVRHAVTCGKGRALKTGFNHLATNYPELLRAAPARALAIGQRSFRGREPLRSLVGNLATRYIFMFLTGHKLKDTQSGLRAMSMSILPELIRLSGEGYEYEMNMLAHTRTAEIALLTTDIETVYIANNRSSHFNPLFDSLKIYFVLLRFVFSSVLSSLIDLAIYSACILGGSSIMLSLAVARAISSFLNFLMNKKYVFLKKSEFLTCLVKYYLLVLFIFAMSYLMVSSMNEYLGLNAILAKVLTETILFVISFLVQRSLVFAKDEEE